MSMWAWGEAVGMASVSAKVLSNNASQANAYQDLAKFHAAYELAMSAEPCPFQLLANAIQPTVTQRDRWMCEDLGIPNVPEDMQ